MTVEMIRCPTEVTVEMLRCPTEEDWMLVKQCALVTIGREAIKPPSREWKHNILEARHSPIRELKFVFRLEIPYWVSTHLARHIHAQPYIRSQRNDRQSEYDRNEARQDATVEMIWSLNAEELMVVANKRLCQLASKETREVVRKMCLLVLNDFPEFSGLLVPMCEYGKCHEMNGCGRNGSD